MVRKETHTSKHNDSTKHPGREDRHSGTGRGTEERKAGAGPHGWGNEPKPNGGEKLDKNDPMYVSDDE